LTAVVAAVVVGAVLVVFVASRVWLVDIQARPAPLPPVEIRRTGASLVPALPALALVALAGAGGLLATRGRARLVVGGLLLLAAVGEIALLAGHVGQSGWVVLGLVGAVLCAAGAAATLWRGRTWPAMGSRYERAGAGEETAPAEGTDGDGGPSAAGQSKGDVAQSKGDVAMWDAIDRGEDPTDGEGRAST
jgi:hypothetical protein